MMSLLLALDAGNSKTDIAAVDPNGRLLARRRQGGFRPHIDGFEISLAVLRAGVATVLAEAGRSGGGTVLAEAGRSGGGGSRVALLAAYLANADLPVQEEQFQAAIQEWGFAERVVVANDTFALLRSGSSGMGGVAVVCGAGINCVGVGHDGAQVRFPALGPLSGDWGGGHGLATDTMFLAARGEDGRGDPTALSAAVARHFGTDTATAVGIGMFLGEIPESRLNEVTPLLFDVAARGDEVALGLVIRQAAEVVTMAGIALRRLKMTDASCEIVLGGGVLAAGHEVMMEPVRRGLLAVAPAARIVVPGCSPLIGAILLGSDELFRTGEWTPDQQQREQAIRMI